MIVTGSSKFQRLYQRYIFILYIICIFILYKCEEYLLTCDNQFRFKPKHSTELCIYTLKEFIDYYKHRSTAVCVTLLDASKAFDKINFWLLFQKLFHKGFPTFIIKI